MSDIYDDPELTPMEGFDNVTFKTVGDRINARVIRMEKIPTRYGRVAKYWLFDNERQCERTMLAGAMDLWAQLHKLRPQSGDIVDIELVDIDGQRFVFNVEVTSGEEPF